MTYEPLELRRIDGLRAPGLQHTHALLGLGLSAQVVCSNNGARAPHYSCRLP
jgi:hypothetical protein